MSNLQALNPLTGAQVDLPPVTGLYHIESFSDEQGNLMYNHYYDDASIRDPWVYRPHELRLFLYHRVFLSCSPSGNQCIVLLQHRPVEELSFARLGDDHWTRIIDVEFLDKEDSFHNAVYNEKDGLFYVIAYDGSIYTLDLKSPSPVARKIMRNVIQFDDCVKYIVLTPGGNILQVWRYTDSRDSTNPIYVPPELAHEYYNPNQEVYTCQMDLYKVDIGEQKIVRIASLENCALFLGFGSTLLLSTKDFSLLRPNCVYLTDDSFEDICLNRHNRQDMGIWDFKTGTIESIGDLQSKHPWLSFPSPVWITPSLC
ncbi:unnamed protein product [Alopecurus aequalis]